MFEASALGRKPMDRVVLCLAVVMLGFGTLMVLTSSAVEARQSFGNPFHYFQRHVVFAVLSLSVMLTLAHVDYRALRPFTYPALLAVAALLVLSVAGLGHSGGGAARWLRLGPITIQPSEAAKLALLQWLALSLSRQGDAIRSFRSGFLRHVGVALALMALCLKQPDFGGAVVLLLLTVSMLFVAGARVVYLLGLFGLGVVGAAWLVRFEPYRWERVLAWLHMADHRQDLAYQPYQAVMALGSGQASGVGFGQGLQLLFLPKAHTDFIAAVVGEELGWVGLSCLCVAYLVIVVRGVGVALRAADPYGTFLAFGVAVLFGIQALINLGVALAILPTKGLTLPFVSYGGSSLLVSGAAMGLLLSVSRVAGPRDVELARSSHPGSTLRVEQERW